MTFQDIFKEEGLYVSDSFRKGVAFRVKKNSIDNRKELFIVHYSSVRDIRPSEEPMTVYDGLFTKTYKKILVRGQLFNK